MLYTRESQGLLCSLFFAAAEGLDASFQLAGIVCTLGAHRLFHLLSQDRVQWAREKARGGTHAARGGLNPTYVTQNNDTKLWHSGITENMVLLCFETRNSDAYEMYALKIKRTSQRHCCLKIS